MKLSRIIGIGVTLALACGLGWLVYQRLTGAEGQGVGEGRGGDRIAPVAVVPIERGVIRDVRTFSGTVEPLAEFVAAPKVAGRVKRLTVQLGDAVTQGQVVAELDDDEFVQAVAQAEAELAVAQANLVEAKAAMEIAQREYGRIQTLAARGVASESQLDQVEAERQTRTAAVQVAEAQVRRAEASAETARIRQGYTRITAQWPGDDPQRFVAERYVDAGYTVAANAPLVKVVSLDPLIAVVFVTEKDYARLTLGQHATLMTDAWPGERFDATVTRLSPVFEQVSRQARVELLVGNKEHKLKPGMFVRAAIDLAEATDAAIVPAEALVRREGQTGVFVVTADRRQARWVEVREGLREGERVQVIGEGLTGEVVTLGQQLLKDGGAIRIPQREPRQAGAEGGER